MAQSTRHIEPLLPAAAAGQTVDLTAASETGTAGALSISKARSVRSAAEANHARRFGAHRDYATLVLADGPELYWRLGDTSGPTAVDASGNGHNGTFFNDVTLDQDGLLDADADGSVLIDNADISGITSTYAPYVVDSQRSFEYWFAPNRVSGALTTVAGSGNYHPTLEWFTAGFGENRLYLRFYPAVTLTYPLGWVDFYGGYAQRGNGIPINTPVHVVLTFDDATGIAELFVNGISQGAHGPLDAFGIDTLRYNETMGNFQVGFRGDVGLWASDYETFSGPIDEVAVYERILTSAEIASHYEAGIAPAGTINKSGLIVPPGESDTAQPLTHEKHISISPATETDGAGTFTFSQPTQVDLVAASEVDTAGGLLSSHTRNLTAATEVDAALALSVTKTIYKALLAPGESDSAPGLLHHKELSISAATEIDTALALLVTKSIYLGVSVAWEADAALALAFVKSVDISPAGEVDSAMHLPLPWYLDLLTATETDSAVELDYELIYLRRRSVGVI